MRRPWLLLAAVLAVDVAVVALGATTLTRSRDLPFAVGAGEETCPWRRAEDSACLTAIGDVTLDATSLMREPAYLDHEAHAAWSDTQRRLADGMAGDHVTVVLDGRRIEARVVPARPSLQSLLLAAFTATLLVAVGGGVLFQRPRLTTARALFWMCQGLLWAMVPTLVNSARGLAAGPDQLHALYAINMVGLVVGAAAALRLFATFPRPILGTLDRRLARDLPLALGAVALGLELGLGVGAVLPFTMVGLAASLGLFVWGQRLPLAHQERLQSRWLLWGMALPVAVFILIRGPYIVGLATGDPDDVLLFLLSISVPFGAAVGILRHRLLDIHVVVRRTIVGAIAAPVVLALYAFLVTVFAGGFQWTAQVQSVATAAFALAFLLVPAQTRIEQLIDRTFFRNRYGYRAILAELPAQLSRQRAADDVARVATERIQEALDVRRVAILQWRAGHGWRAPDGVEAPDTDAAAALRSAETWHLRGDGGPVDDWLTAHDLALAMPLRVGDQAVGTLALSALPGRRLYASDDLNLLWGTASAIALALAQANALELLEDLNRDLEDRIERRTQDLQEARMQLFRWEKLAALGVLSAGIAHELNTPLGVVQSTVDQLAGRAEPGSIDARLSQLALEGARRAADIVADLSRFARADPTTRSRFDLHETLDSALRLVERKLRAHGIRVEQDRAPGPLLFDGYAAAIHQTLINLITNATQAVDSDGVVRLTVRDEGDAVVITVDDDGPGVPEALRERIFEPFFTTRGGSGGTGLGLSLCHRYARDHGGSLVVGDSPLGGARFTIRLPRDGRDDARSPA